MVRTSTIELFKEQMKFSAGHFAIFSSEVRENLHGHNYTVYASFKTIIEDEGMSFHYRFYKDKLRSICDSIDETTIIPGNCKYIKIEDHGTYYHVLFNTETLIFLKRDVTILPITNVTIEELSSWILKQLLLDEEELKRNRIQKIKVKVFSGPGQSGSSEWKVNNG